MFENVENMFEYNYQNILASNQGESNLALKNVDMAMNLIKDEFKIPFLLYYNGFKYHEIAESHTLPIGTVKSRIHIAKYELRKKLNRF